MVRFSNKHPLSKWIAAHCNSTRIFRDLVQEELGGKPISIYTVDQWRAGRRIPRPEAMLAIMKVTDNEITANDFLRREKRK